MRSEDQEGRKREGGEVSEDQEEKHRGGKSRMIVLWSLFSASASLQMQAGCRELLEACCQLLILEDNRGGTQKQGGGTKEILI